MNFIALSGLAAVAVLSSACGGGDDDAPPSAAPAVAALAPDCTAVQRLVMANTVFKSAIHIDAGAVTSGTTKMPAHCLVTGEINPRAR